MWVKVKSNKEVPVGTWLVKLTNKSFHVAVIDPAISIIGNHFDFDMKPIESYYNIEVDSI